MIIFSNVLNNIIWWIQGKPTRMYSAEKFCTQCGRRLVITTGIVASYSEKTGKPEKLVADIWCPHCEGEE